VCAWSMDSWARRSLITVFLEGVWGNFFFRKKKFPQLIREKSGSVRRSCGQLVAVDVRAAAEVDAAVEEVAAGADGNGRLGEYGDAVRGRVYAGDAFRQPTTSEVARFTVSGGRRRPADNL